MKGRVGLLLVSILAATWALAPGDASAWTVNLKGPAKGGGWVGLTLDDRVRAVQARVSWSARCGRGKFNTRTAIDFRSELLKPGKFAVRGSYRGRGRGYRYVVRLRFRGKEAKRFVKDADRPEEVWKGRFRARVTVRRGGRVLTKCRSRNLRWTADGGPNFPEDTPSGRIEMQSEPGHFVGQGETYSFATRNGDGSPTHLEFGDAGTWSLVFEPPGEQRLAPGTYTIQRPPGASGDYGSIRISGENRACSSDSGQFTVQSIAFDAWGDLTSAVVSFEHRCGNGSGILRGTISYTRGY